MQVQAAVLRTLLYYDIWSHPLTEEELFMFLPVNSMSFEQFRNQIRAMPRDLVASTDGFYFLTASSSAVVKERLRRMRHARRMWLLARFATHIIKRFPFVRAVLVSGDLSKNATHKKSDVDFLIITEPGRVWITRTLLILFKKIFLLNSKKFFCINSLLTTDALRFDEHNIYTATEVATLKPLYNSRLFYEYLKANEWIKQFFPNFEPKNLRLPACNNKPSVLQRLLEAPFRLIDADRLDMRLMEMMKRVWARRYPTIDDQTRARIFRCTRGESRAFVGNFQDTILALYAERLNRFGLLSESHSSS